jgi:hypothetical protein
MTLMPGVRPISSDEAISQRSSPGAVTSAGNCSPRPRFSQARACWVGIPIPLLTCSPIHPRSQGTRLQLRSQTIPQRGQIQIRRGSNGDPLEVAAKTLGRQVLVRRYPPLVYDGRPHSRSAAWVAALDPAVVEAEQRCETLARRQQFVQGCGTSVWPKGTLATRYRFRHTLYHERLYEWVPVARRIHLHRQTGLRLEAAYGSRASEVAGELAVHFVPGREAERAVQYLHIAGENAGRHSAWWPEP